MEASHTRRYLHAILAPLQGGTAIQRVPSSLSSSSLSLKNTSSLSTTASSEGEDDSEGEDGDNDDDENKKDKENKRAAQPRRASSSSSGSNANASMDNDNEHAGNTNTSASTSTSTRSSFSSGHGGGQLRGLSTLSSLSSHSSPIDVETRTRRVLELLADTSLADEDKPERLKELLVESTLDLDSAVLAILHRYREDLSPTGQSFSSPAHVSRPTPGSLSRSSSYRRTLTPSSAAVNNLALKRSGMATPTRPISPSPLRAQSPSIHAAKTHDPFAHVFEASNSANSSYASTGPGSSAPSSPFGSPRMLNAGASEFKPNVAAAEFRPGPPSLSVKMPDPFATIHKSRSPIGTPLNESASPTVWAFQNSPLGTPKFATGTTAAATSGGSYFGSSSTVMPSLSASTSGPAIPSDPWNKFNESSVGSSSSNPGISTSSSTASSESSHDEAAFDPFAGSGYPEQQLTSGKSQILSTDDDDEDEWGMPTTSYDEATRRNNALGGMGSENASPQWNLYEDEDDDDDLAMLSFAGGKLVPDDMTLVEPPNKQRPIFDEHYQPQSTSQYSQLPQDFDSSGEHQLEQFQGHGAQSGLGAASANYIMTPFDVLFSVFSGSDISAAELEEALSRTGWDVDKAMEWIISNPRPPGLGGSGAQVDNLNSLLAAMDMNDHVGGPMGMPSPRLKPPTSGSASRPLIVSRDSFQRQYGGLGRPSSPRWPSGPGTPGGRSDRSGDGYFGSAQPAPGATPSTRLCKYYLQGNCLRSDCRFSHDLSKAVCKFWLRGHCLKGEDRCEFLHSVPPHLAQDVAQLRASALRNREQEKARWMNRDDDIGSNGGRGEDDFPTLAAATASVSARAQALPGLQLPKDAATTRWAGAVKNGRPLSHLPVNSRPSLPRTASNSSRTPGRTNEPSPPFSQPRQSSRLALRPPTLLQTVSTGASVSRMYEEYRQQFFEYGNARNKCLVKASACFKAGDGAGAKRWSKEAQDWNRQIATEGSAAAEGIVSERKKVLKEAVLAGVRPGRADDVADRQYRGSECGRGLGICLGVAAAGETLGPEGARLSAAERTEVALDLHGLHPAEGIDILERFLLGITTENIMRGLVFVIVGQERHTGSADPARGSRKVRLIDAVGAWLDSYGYAFWLVQGVLAIDAFSV